MEEKKRSGLWASHPSTSSCRARPGITFFFAQRSEGRWTPGQARGDDPRFRKVLAALARRYGEGAGDPAALAGDARRAAAVHHRAAAVEVDGEPAAIHLRVLLDEADPADQGDDAPLEIVDADVAAGGLGRAADGDSAGGVDPAQLDSAAARISDGEAGGGEGEVALADDDVAREDGAVGAVLDLDPVGGDVDRRVAVMALEGRGLAESRARCRARRAAGRGRGASCRSSEPALLDMQARPAGEDDPALRQVDASFRRR